jgi:hypothetical protein
LGKSATAAPNLLYLKINQEKGSSKATPQISPTYTTDACKHTLSIILAPLVIISSTINVVVQQAITDL